METPIELIEKKLSLYKFMATARGFSAKKNEARKLVPIYQKALDDLQASDKASNCILSIVSNNEERVTVGCGSCKHKRLEMSEEPCLNCIGYYSKWKQQTDC